MQSKQLLIVGSTAPDVVKLIASINRVGADNLICEGFLDDDPAKQGTEFMGHAVVGTTADLETRFKNFWVVNNVGKDTPTRYKVAQRLKSLGVTRNLTLIHPSVDKEYAEIGTGCIIHEGVVLGPYCQIGHQSVVYPHAAIGHESVVGEVVFVSNNAIAGARGTVGTGAFIGLGSIVLPYLDIGAWSTVGAGSVVLRNVKPETTVFGNPARVIDRRESAAG